MRAGMDECGSSWAARLGELIAEAEGALDELRAGLDPESARTMKQRVRTAVMRAQGRAGWLDLLSALGRAGPQVDPDPGPSLSDAERLKVLQLLERGAITAAQADMLLQALEG